MRILKSILSLCRSVAQVILLLPVYLISGLVRRNERRVVFGCHLSKPAGNVLHFFRHCVESGTEGYEFMWVAKNNETYDFILGRGLPVVKKFSLAGVWWCLTSGFYCYSSYVSDVSYFFSRGVRGVNVWHGTPLKKIEADVDAGIYKLRYKYKWLFGSLQPWVFFKAYRIFVSSNYESQCFLSAFNIGYESMYKTYPPRLMDFERAAREDGFRHILIAPTFRDGTKLQYDRLVDFERLDGFGVKNGIVFHIKAHPSDESLVGLNAETFSNICKVDRLSDIYSVISEMDAVITDYSSIFFDCSYIDIPFFLHWPDADFYNSKCRGFYFDAKLDFGDVFSEDMDGLLSNLQSWLALQDGHVRSVAGNFSCYEPHVGYPISVFGDTP